MLAEGKWTLIECASFQLPFLLRTPAQCAGACPLHSLRSRLVGARKDAARDAALREKKDSEASGATVRLLVPAVAVERGRREKPNNWGEPKKITCGPVRKREKRHGEVARHQLYSSQHKREARRSRTAQSPHSAWHPAVRVGLSMRALSQVLSKSEAFTPYPE